MDLQSRMGQRLAEVREARGLSQHQLAKVVGVTSQFVGRLESGATRAFLPCARGLSRSP